MAVYPNNIDDDSTIQRLDDNLSTLGTEVINQLRSAVFALEIELGIKPSGSAGSVVNRLGVSLNPDGSIKASALTSVGLATLPIVDNQVASNAGIKETKLSLDFKTSDLHTLISANTALLNSLTTFALATSSDLIAHISGANLLSNGDPAKHLLSHILINQHPTDPRDLTFTWGGLKDKFGNLRTATQAMEAMDQINTDLIDHENAISDAHAASSITVDTDNFTQIPVTATDLQQVVDYIDDAEELNMGTHRATQHSNGIPRVARSQSLVLPDGYEGAIVPVTPVHTYLVHTPNVNPVDDLSIGDDLIKFLPTDPTSDFVFDSQFSQVKPGDLVTIDYGRGFETKFLIDSIRYVAGTEWIVRINGTNLCEADGYARIDRSPVDFNTSGVLALASANATPTGSFSTILSSLIVGDPRGAVALGLGFDANKFDSTHYKLYLEFYPTGNPSDKLISLPAIDVTGNAGITPGKYTLEDVVQNINNNFRQIGYNYRFLAFTYRGQIGIMLADSINNASFAIIDGSNSSGTLSTGIYTQNVIGGSTLDDFDGLGLGPLNADLASPTFQTSFVDATAAQLPTKIISPVKNRFYYVNGQRKDKFAPGYLTNTDGYWDGYIAARNPIGSFTVETTYSIPLDLEAAGLKAGKTLTIQPAVLFTDPLYFDLDYGRFIIKTVHFIAACGTSPAETQITVINGISGTGAGFGFSSGPTLPVRIYFGEDSVDFDIEEVIDQVPTSTEYRRHHEIYIDSIGHTFSHERARMPRQAEDALPGFLSTSRFHIRDVAPKLRGYRDSSIIVKNKFIRFYVIDYDTSTGEFDGYLGERVSAASSVILRTGPIVKSRKNTPTRFYDETGIDFIELEYTEDFSSNIISGLTPRFVDIELFPSLQLDESVFYLGSAEVNWTPDTSTDVVKFVNNARQFGSVGEENFTDSALEFISVGDKLLHQNGVIRGFDFDSINATDNREIYLKGGIANVNGKIVSANNQSVVIPSVYPFGSSLPQTVNWAICVNESGELIPIVITSTKTQFFATIGAGFWYLPSTTFSELVLTRKDLLPLYLVTSHVISSSSFTISTSDLQDVRKFTQSEGANHPLTLSSDTQVGNFNNFTSLLNYLRAYNGKNNKVIIRGDFTLSDEIDLSGLSSRVVFEGEGTNITTTSGKGFVLGSNLVLKNLVFNYAPTGLTLTGNINSGNGCLYAASGVDLEDITVEDCIFNCTQNTTLRPPFINFELATNQVISRLTIRNNDFNDLLTVNQAAVAIINNNTGGSSNPAVVEQAIIEGNKCSASQSIYLTSIAVSGSYAVPGLSAINVHISENLCGGIGFVTSALKSTSTSVDGYAEKQGITIRHNHAEFIGGLDGITGQFETASVPYASGSILIEGNVANWIQTYSQNDGTINSASKIINNRLIGFNAAYGTSIYGISNIAIYVFDGSGGVRRSDVLISGNTTNFNSAGTSGYSSGIFCTQNGRIVNNSIRGLVDTGSGSFGILILSIGSSLVRFFHIEGNEIYRVGNSITSYIFIDANSTNSSGFIIFNHFDSTTVDGSSHVLISNIPVSWTVGDNRNYIKTLNATVAHGYRDVSILTTDDSDPQINLAHAVIVVSNIYTNMIAQPDKMTVIYADTTTIASFQWVIPLFGVIPEGALLHSVSVDYDFGTLTGVPSATKHIYLTVASSAGFDQNTYTIAAPDVGNVVTKTLGAGGTAFSFNYKNNWDTSLFVSVVANIKDASTALSFAIKNFNISYKF